MSSTDSQTADRQQATKQERWMRLEIRLLRSQARVANTQRKVWLRADLDQRTAALERMSRTLYC
jgi:hypothetical protein